MQQTEVIRSRLRKRKLLQRPPEEHLWPRIAITIAVLLSITMMVWARGSFNVPGQRHPYPSPLHLACRSGHLTWARFLLAMGARPDATYQEGLTPLHDLVRYCRDEKQSSGCSQTLGYLLTATPPLEAKARLNSAVKGETPDRVGTTPLEWACCYQQRVYIERLVRAGAKSEKALMLAMEQGDIQTVRILRDAGASVDRQKVGLLKRGQRNMDRQLR